MSVVDALGPAADHEHLSGANDTAGVPVLRDLLP
jgi:hypothetical protein